MTIRAYPDLTGAAPADCAFYAITDDYDGAPDAGPIARAMGFGATEADAIADLRRLLDELADAEDPRQAEYDAREPHPGDTP